MNHRSWHRHYDAGVPASIRYPHIIVPDIIQIPAKTYPDKPALVFEGKEITFWELRLQILRFANALAPFEIKKGDRVGLHLPTCPQYVISYYALLSLGAIVVNLNPLYTVEELQGTAHTTGMSALITNDMSLDTARILVKTADIKKVIVARISDYSGQAINKVSSSFELEEGWHSFTQIMENCTNTRKPRVNVSPDDVAVIQFTGGTTGIPKGAMLTHKNIIASAVQLSFWMSPLLQLIAPERRLIPLHLPLYHVYGNLIMNWSIYSCARQILIPRFQIDEVMELLKSCEEILFFPTVATVISALLGHPKINELGLGKKLTLINSGGGPTALHLMEQLDDMGIYTSQGWGMSETAATGTSTPMFSIRKINSIGIPYPDNDVKLVDLENGVDEVPQGEPGEIIIKSPTVMKGYWNNPEETAEQLKNGWLYTGDIAIQDEDDFLFIVDRKKDMVISGGFNIYPREVDEVLFQHPKVEFGIAVGVPDEYRGETLKAFIVLKKGQSATDKEIIDFCKEKLAPYKVPKLMEFRDSLPQSSVGKVLRKELRAEEIKKNTGK
ncbi:MAG: AMP-binding protein [Candidatus Vecturithrix sp.]|nr:AMP-binding protein [Candidatus Vecturithrix sp.]